MRAPINDCSFCGRGVKQGHQLLRGPTAAICEDCMRRGIELLTAPQVTSRPGDVLLEIVTAGNGALTDIPPTHRVASYLNEVRRQPSVPESERRVLLAQSRAAEDVDDREAAVREVVTAQLEVVALIALAAAPPAVDPLNAVQEANILFVELVKDVSVEDPILALAAALPSRLRKIARDADLQHEP